MKRKHAGQIEIPLPGAIGFAHDPDETFAAEYGRDKMEAERAAYIAERACTCGSPKPGTLHARNMLALAEFWRDEARGELRGDRDADAE